MATLEISDILDHTVATLADLGRNEVSQIAQELVSYQFADHILREDKMKFDSGSAIQKNLMTNHNDAARHVGLFQQDDYNVGDVLQNITVPWRHTNTNWSFDAHEIDMNSGGAKIVDIIKTRRTSGMLAFIELLDEAGWNKPTDDTDKLEPFGIPYWIVKNTSDGFNGGNPSGFTSGAGGVSSTAFPTWANYTNQYVNTTKTDLIKKMRKAKRLTDFKTPIGVKDFRMGAGDQYRIYVNGDTIESLEDLGEAQNENLGRDLNSMDGLMTFGGNPIIYVPQLDSDSSDPVYGLNFNSMEPVFLNNWFMKESTPRIAPLSHNTVVVDVDTTWNFLVKNRRSNFVISK